MKRIRCLLGIILVLILLVGCENNQTKFSHEEIESKETEIEQLKSQIITLENALVNKESENNQVKGDYTIYKEHYHYLESYADAIYVIIRKGDPKLDDIWTDTLWQLGPNKSNQIFEGKGLDFRVSPDEQYIAVSTDLDLSLLDSEGNLLKQFSQSELDSTKNVHLNLLKWNDIGDVLWLESQETYITKHYIRIDMNSLHVDVYENQFVMGDDYDLDPNTGQIVYSDYPVFFDEEALKAYQESQVSTNLYYYDLNLQKKAFVRAATTTRFSPKWISNDQFTYHEGSEIKTSKKEDIFFEPVPEVNLSDLPEVWQRTFEHISRYEGQLTNQEINVINTLFQPMYDVSNLVIVNPISCFFTSEYDQVENLDFVEFLRYFPYGQVPDTLPEFNELKTLEQWPFTNINTFMNMPVPIHKYSFKDLNETLILYAGIALDEIKGIYDDEVFYLSSTHAFYNYTSDFAPGYFQITSGQVKDSVITLYGTTNEMINRQLTLVLKDNQYVIQSFKSYE
ncbi:MAG: hypothetical protein JXR88_06840 [Clostridia bacterium]|nr:hypothetical protein [Clostridia bacterium]